MKKIYTIEYTSIDDTYEEMDVEADNSWDAVANFFEITQESAYINNVYLDEEAEEVVSHDQFVAPQDDEFSSHYYRGSKWV